MIYPEMYSAYELFSQPVCFQLLETEGLSKSQELENLRLRLSSEEDRHNESRKEATKLKTKVSAVLQQKDKLSIIVIIFIMTIFCTKCAGRGTELGNKI